MSKYGSGIQHIGDISLFLGDSVILSQPSSTAKYTQ